MILRIHIFRCAVFIMAMISFCTAQAEVDALSELLKKYSLQLTEEKVPSKKVEMKNSNHYTLQLAALNTEEEAKAFNQKLLKQNIDSSYSRANVNGKIWYRVNVGEYSSAAEARVYAQGHLMPLGFSVIVKNASKFEADRSVASEIVKE